ncbi:MAG: hypothetical protein HMLIMOIP_001177 [Candidatus Nitrosomirales archaeon]|jgi:hypothetical protein
MSTYVITRIDDASFRKLIFVKKLYEDALQRMSASEIDRMMAISQLDAAIELVLRCIPSFFRKPLDVDKEIDYTTFWQATDDLLLEHCKPPLPLKRTIFRLHDARDSIQLYGTVADTPIVEEYALFVELFMKKIFRDIFSLDFKTISMSWII